MRIVEGYKVYNLGPGCAEVEIEGHRIMGQVQTGKSGIVLSHVFAPSGCSLRRHPPFAARARRILGKEFNRRRQLKRRAEKRRAQEDDFWQRKSEQQDLFMR